MFLNNLNARNNIIYNTKYALLDINANDNSHNHPKEINIIANDINNSIYNTNQSLTKDIIVNDIFNDDNINQSFTKDIIVNDIFKDDECDKKPLNVFNTDKCEKKDDDKCNDKKDDKCEDKCDKKDDDKCKDKYDKKEDKCEKKYDDKCEDKYDKKEDKCDKKDDDKCNKKEDKFNDKCDKKDDDKCDKKDDDKCKDKYDKKEDKCEKKYDDKKEDKCDKKEDKCDKKEDKCEKKEDECAKQLKLKELLSFNSQLSNKYFLALLVITLIGAIMLILNAFTNYEIVEIEVYNSIGVTLTWYVIISILVAILTAHMLYKPYVLDSYANQKTVLYALIYYELAYVYWSTTLFKSRLERGQALVASVILLGTTIWLGWVCYHYDKNTIYIFLILLLYTLYLQLFTVYVAHNPWKAVGNISNIIII